MLWLLAGIRLLMPFEIQSTLSLEPNPEPMLQQMVQYEVPDFTQDASSAKLADKTIIPMPGVQQETADSIAETFPLEPQDLPMIEFEGGVELLRESIVMKSLAGYATDATGDMDPLYEYFTITSAILHEEEQRTLQAEADTIQNELQQEEKKSVDVKRFLAIVKKYTDLTELTSEILREFVDKIIVHAPDKSSGRRLQEIEIIYNHIGEFDHSKVTLWKGNAV